MKKVVDMLRKLDILDLLNMISMVWCAWWTWRWWWTREIVDTGQTWWLFSGKSSGKCGKVLSFLSFLWKQSWYITIYVWAISPFVIEETATVSFSEMTSKQVSDSNNQQINDLHRLIKKYHAIRNIVKVLLVIFNVSYTKWYIKNPQNNEILPLTFQKDYHESKIYPIVPRWAKQYFQRSNYNDSDDLFWRLKKIFCVFPGTFCCETWSRTQRIIQTTR